MKNYINTKPKYGYRGPYKANSKEEVADMLKESFDIWAKERIVITISTLYMDYTSKQTIINSLSKALRDEFVDGLREI